MVVSGLSYNSYQFIYIVFFLFNGTGYFWNEVKLIRQLCSIQSLNLALFWPDPFSVSSIVFRPLFPALTPCSPRTLFLTIKPRHFIFHWWFTFKHGFVCASILILFSLKLILILKPVSDIIVKLTHTHTVDILHAIAVMFVRVFKCKPTRKWSAKQRSRINARSRKARPKETSSTAVL